MAILAVIFVSLVPTMVEAIRARREHKARASAPAFERRADARNAAAYLPSAF